ncbi:HIT domain-containing protein [Patescibacteria group bacterium]|nr:HIT domain-containing protein [Patescibacteria group bacterium]
MFKDLFNAKINKIMVNSNCIFCKIASGQIPCYKTYEDNDFYGFLDIKPLSIGNSLLIPKKHYPWVYDVPNFGKYWQAAKKLALTTQKIVKADFISFLTLGTEIPHAHIRIIPRWLNDHHRGKGIDATHIVKIPSKQMAQIADKIYKSIK